MIRKRFDKDMFDKCDIPFDGKSIKINTIDGLIRWKPNKYGLELHLDKEVSCIPNSLYIINYYESLIIFTNFIQKDDNNLIVDYFDIIDSSKTSVKRLTRIYQSLNTFSL